MKRRRNTKEEAQHKRKPYQEDNPIGQKKMNREMMRKYIMTVKIRRERERNKKESERVLETVEPNTILVCEHCTFIWILSMSGSNSQHWDGSVCMDIDIL